MASAKRHGRAAKVGCTSCACMVLIACGQSSAPTVSRPAAARDRAALTQDATETESVARGSALNVVPAVTTLNQRAVCGLISISEMTVILGAGIGKPIEEDSPGTSACLYPPVDAQSAAQAHIEIQWNHGAPLSPEEQLAQAVGGEAGRAVAHNGALGDDSTYSLDGTLRIRTGKSLIEVELPMRPDAEDKAVVIGRLLLSRLGVEGVQSAAKKAAVSPQFPEGLHVGEDCPAVLDNPHAEESALVPLKVGLTLSNIWNGGDDDYDHEMLLQVIAVTDTYIDITQSSPRGADHHTITSKRRLCRASLRDSFFYRTETARNEPPVLSNTNMFSLSSRSLHELKTAQSTRHRYIEFGDDWNVRAQPLDRDVDEVLRSSRFDRGSYVVQVNGRQVELPVVTALAGGNQPWQTSIKVLDDERLPFMLEYQIPGYGLKIRYTKISYPADDDMEHQLAVDKHVDVYGIYFDFASDRLRPESTPVLEEIAALLKKNPAWRLSINGHTDNVGGDTSNLDLSRRRAKSVRTALVDGYGISEARLTSGGFGASQPHEKNDTPEGRARNRRVELTRL